MLPKLTTPTTKSILPSLLLFHRYRLASEFQPDCALGVTGAGKASSIAVRKCSSRGVPSVSSRRKEGPEPGPPLPGPRRATAAAELREIEDGQIRPKRAAAGLDPRCAWSLKYTFKRIQAPYRIGCGRI